VKNVCVIKRYWPDLCRPEDLSPDAVSDLRDLIEATGFAAAPLNIVELP